MILLSWAGRFFLPLVAMETFLKAAIWKLVKAAKELATSPAALLLSQGYWEANF